ncbi:hypothetical protein TREMEDRAFT_57960, partial [Tremella mesenterica DSM 1558]|uniref:uncharacterized protein n=1 Tax=Tremella mesenterica (strain ATCC 24925 / CBS 8224 / DSM 1558 / NBRC 9311 / NRRL Y-6157 / RJB 2259-6 / UBC 559-6) TaxID=578456 RepID=UPI00032C8A03
MRKDQVKLQETLAGLARMMYEKVFQYVVSRMNQTFLGHGEIESDEMSISFLDLYRFENMSHNSLEQLCINWTNEKLQQSLNDNFFKKLSDTFSAQGCESDSTMLPGRSPRLEWIEGRNHSFAACLNDIRPSDRQKDDDSL